MTLELIDSYDFFFELYVSGTGFGPVLRIAPSKTTDYMTTGYAVIEP